MALDLKKIKHFLKHLFTPQESNNYRAKYLHHDFMTGLILVLLLVNLGFRFALGNLNNNVLGISVDLTVAQLLKDTNLERTKNGLKPLKINPLLTQAAKDKSLHMFTNNYWSHFSPDGTSPWYFFEKNNYDYSYAGENLAKNFSNSDDIVNAWMNSSKHRENILKPEYEEVGFSISEGKLQGEPTILVVQFFGTEDKTNLAVQKPKILSAVKSSTITKITPSVTLAPAALTKESIQKKPFIDLSVVKKQLVFFVLALLIIALSLDLYFSQNKNLLIFSGRNIAHIAFVIVFIISILIIKPGLIL